MSEQPTVTTASGLRYMDLVEGTGPSPAAGERVEVHYTGWLENGTEFDSSLDRRDSFTQYASRSGGLLPGSPRDPRARPARQRRAAS